MQIIGTGCAGRGSIRAVKPLLAQWIVDQRKAARLETWDIAGRLGVSDSTVRGWEAGRRPKADNLRELERLFGQPAPGSAPRDELGGLAAALSELAVELRATREDRRAVEARLRALETAARLQGPPDDEARPARSPHQETAE
jgi:transcriptional regulator with XRE-family HTH domain